MTDTYLRSLGFAPTMRATRATRADFSHTWRYQFDHAAIDGAHLFIEHPLGIDSCRLSALESPLAAQDVFASVGLHDRPGFEAAIKAFYVAHGGMGPLLATTTGSSFRPYQRQL